MEQIGRYFDFPKNENLKKLDFPSGRTFLWEKKKFGPDTFQDAGVCSQQAGNIHY